MTTEIHGFCEDRFKPLADAFRANFDDGLEVGASVALIHDGKTVVDLWGGHRDFARTKPWEKDTVVQVYSAAKIAVVMSLLMLVDQGRVDLDTAVATYWPEFAAGGKDRVTVRDALAHCGGVPGFDPPMSFTGLHDWRGACANLADQPHWFGGERRLAYHFMTYGHLLGEIIRRVDGRGPAQFFYEEIADKIGIEHRMGLRTPAERERVAEIGSLEPLEFPPMEGLEARAFASTERGDWNSLERMSAEIPATGYANGRSLARLFGIGAGNGSLDGVRFLSPQTVREACTTQIHSDDFLGAACNMGLGVAMDIDAFPLPTPTSAQWGGAGGAQGLMDPATGISYGYAMNNMIMEGSQIAGRRWERLWGALGEVMTGL